MKRIIVAALFAISALSFVWASSDGFAIAAGVGYVNETLTRPIDATHCKDDEFEFYDISLEFDITQDILELYGEFGLLSPKTVNGTPIDDYNAARSWYDPAKDEMVNPSLYGFKFNGGGGFRLSMGDADLSLDGYFGVKVIHHEIQELGITSSTKLRTATMGARAKLSLHILPFLHIWGSASAELNLSSQTDFETTDSTGTHGPKLHYELDDEAGSSYSYAIGAAIFF